MSIVKFNPIQVPSKDNTKEYYIDKLDLSKLNDVGLPNDNIKGIFKLSENDFYNIYTKKITYSLSYNEKDKEITVTAYVDIGEGYTSRATLSQDEVINLFEKELNKSPNLRVEIFNRIFKSAMIDLKNEIVQQLFDDELYINLDLVDYQATFTDNSTKNIVAVANSLTFDLAKNIIVVNKIMFNPCIERPKALADYNINIRLSKDKQITFKNFEESSGNIVTLKNGLLYYVIDKASFKFLDGVTTKIPKGERITRKDRTIPEGLMITDGENIKLLETISPKVVDKYNIACNKYFTNTIDINKYLLEEMI